MPTLLQKEEVNIKMDRCKCFSSWKMPRTFISGGRRLCARCYLPRGAKQRDPVLTEDHRDVASAELAQEADNE